MDHFLPRTVPEGLEALIELALDTRWTWSHAGDALWRKLDRELWERTRSPWAILQNTPQGRLEALANDPVSQHELQRAVAERLRYLNEPGLGSAGLLPSQRGQSPARAMCRLRTLTASGSAWATKKC